MKKCCTKGNCQYTKPSVIARAKVFPFWEATSTHRTMSGESAIIARSILLMVLIVPIYQHKIHHVQSINIEQIKLCKRRCSRLGKKKQTDYIYRIESL